MTRLGIMNEVLWAVVAIAVLAFTIGALVSIARSTRGLTNVGSLTWALIALCLPVIGSAWWFLVGRRAAREAASTKR